MWMEWIDVSGIADGLQDLLDLGEAKNHSEFLEAVKKIERCLISVFPVGSNYFFCSFGKSISNREARVWRRSFRSTIISTIPCSSRYSDR